MIDFLVAGGYSMWVTLLLGVLLLAKAGQFALRGATQTLALVRVLSGMTVAAGGLGFCLGIMATVRYVQQIPPADQFITACGGAKESLHNLVLAGILYLFSQILLAIGMWRNPR